jgi:hypothetical protein
MGWPASTASTMAQQRTGGQRADRIERGRQRQRALHRHAPGRRLEAGQAAQRRGMRTEPPVSVPMATTAMPSVTDTAAPD